MVTGGAGFIGSHFVKFCIERNDDVTVLDNLTYAGDLSNLEEYKDRVRFVRGDIRKEKDVAGAMRDCDTVVHFAAESHVDRSISDPSAFITTNIEGTGVLLGESVKLGVKKFVHISTDEVYGSTDSGSFKETDPLKPSSPYSASKAGADDGILVEWKGSAESTLTVRRAQEKQ